MKQVVLNGIAISCCLIFSQSFAEDSILQESSSENFIKETTNQETVVNVGNEETKAPEHTIETSTEGTECKEKKIQTISISNSSIHSIDTDFNQIAESTRNGVTEIAKELNLKDFNLTMTDQYASRNGYSMTTYDYTESFSMTFQYDKNAFDVFLKKLSPINISSSISRQGCSN